MSTRARFRPAHVVIAGLLAFDVSSALGCAGIRRVTGFSEQAAQRRAAARIVGRIDTEGPAEGVLVVVLARPGESAGDPPIGVDSFVRMRPGSYAFPVSPGRYQVGAYEDRNRNGLVDPGERLRRIATSRVLEVGPGESATDDILLAVGASMEGQTEPIDVLGLLERTPREQSHFSLWAWTVQGAICESLDDEAFAEAAGQRGLWEIMDFLNEGRAGIYFLEPYDPTRVPVLFVHGIGGSPRQFSTLIEGLDRKRFQPWFYFYPSGFPLAGISAHLATLLERLNVQHGFDEIAIVAHSIGGLVSRAAILGYWQSTGRDDVRLFVSISTPWGGDVRARRAEEAPIELPESFRDLRPESDFLRSLFYEDEAKQRTRALPEQVEFHMIFGFRMSGSSSTANDGTVTVPSEARIEAQEQAQSVRALDHGHVDILHAPETVGRLNRLLDRRF